MSESEMSQGVYTNAGRKAERNRYSALQKAHFICVINKSCRTLVLQAWNNALILVPAEEVYELLLRPG